MNFAGEAHHQVFSLKTYLASMSLSWGSLLTLTKTSFTKKCVAIGQPKLWS